LIDVARSLHQIHFWVVLLKLPNVVEVSGILCEGGSISQPPNSQRLPEASAKPAMLQREPGTFVAHHLCCSYTPVWLASPAAAPPETHVH